MKRIIFIFILSLAIQARAQQESFHLVKYTAPKNWVVNKHEKVNIYTKEDEAKGTYCNIIIYTEMPSKGNAQKDFNFAWQDLLAKPFTINATPNILPQGNIKGWALLNGNAQYQNNGVTSLAMLFTFTGEEKMQAIAIIANSMQFKTEIEQFIASVDVGRPINTSNVQPATHISNANKSLAPEVWTITKSKYNYSLKASRLENEWMALYPDGNYYPYLAEGGFLGFSEQLKNDSWGTYTKQGDKIIAKNKFQTYTFQKVGIEQLKYEYSSSLWYKCKSVDGLLLDGAYSPEASYYAGYNDITALANLKERDIIFFKKDGTFINEGLSYSNVTSGKISTLGKGTYYIKNFSLVLNFADGRKVQVAFTGIKNTDPFKETAGYVINGLLNYKLGKQFTARN